MEKKKGGCGARGTGAPVPRPARATRARRLVVALESDASCLGFNEDIVTEPRCQALAPQRLRMPSST